MADKNIKKEIKKPKKSAAKAATAPSSTIRPIAAQPELIKKDKKQK